MVRTIALGKTRISAIKIGFKENICLLFTGVARPGQLTALSIYAVRSVIPAKTDLDPNFPVENIH